MFIRLVVLLSLFICTESFAGYHKPFDEGFDDFAKEQGFESFHDYKKKVHACANLLLMILDRSTKSLWLRKVYPPEVITG